MRNIFLCAAVVVATGASLAAEDLPKAETILDKYIEVTGGKAAYEKNHSEMSTGTMEFVGKGIKGTVSSYRAAPDKLYTEVNIEEIGKVKEGSAGKPACTLSARRGPPQKDGDDRASSLH